MSDSKEDQEAKEQEWIRIYRETIVPLYACAHRRTGGDRALSEDVTQEAWLRALEDWPRKGIPRKPLAWLRTVVRNLLANHYRRRRPLSLDRPPLDLGEESRAPATPEAAALLHHGLSRIGREQARLIEAFHIDGRSIGAIAAETGLSERAVEGRLRRARQKLARVLGAPKGSEGSSLPPPEKGGGEVDSRPPKSLEDPQDPASRRTP